MSISHNDLIHVFNQVLRKDINTYKLSYTLTEEDTLIVSDPKYLFLLTIHILEEMNIEVERNLK